MTQIKDNIIDRDALQASYIDRIIDGMDLKDLMQIVYDQLDDSLDKYSVDELIEEVDSYYPELLEESEENKTSWLSGTRGWHSAPKFAIL